MANRDAKLIERTLKDFSLGAMSGGGGLAPVDKLPEKGNVGTLYKTPDGNIYSWFREETQKEVEVPPTLEVGKTYELKESIPLDEFQSNMNKITGGHEFNVNVLLEDEPFTYTNGEEPVNEFWLNEWQGETEGDYGQYVAFQGDNGTEEGAKASYGWNGRQLPPLELELDVDDVQTPVMIKITQEFVDKLSELEVTLHLQDIAFIFKGTTEVITTVNEGYTQLNGIVLDYDKIINNAIFLDDKNYNAQIICDTLLRGGNVLLKTTKDASSFDISNLKNTYFEYYDGKLDKLTITFSDYDETTIDVFLKNQFNPISTIKGQELIDLIQTYPLMEINNRSLLGYIGSVSSREEAIKNLYRGIAISLFEGLVEYRVFYTLPDEELAASTVTQIANFAPRADEEEVLHGSEGEELNLVVISHNINDASVNKEDVSSIVPTKNYNCDIIVKFSDDTTKTVPMDMSLLYGEEGNDESPLFRIHYTN